MAAETEACTILNCPNTGVAGSNLILGMDNECSVRCPVMDCSTDLTILILSEIINSDFEQTKGPNSRSKKRRCTFMNLY